MRRTTPPPAAPPAITATFVELPDGDGDGVDDDDEFVPVYACICAGVPRYAPARSVVGHDPDWQGFDLQHPQNVSGSFPGYVHV